MTALGADVALAAREVLAASTGGELHVHGLGRLGAEGTDVLFYDDDGRPTFLAPPNSPVAVAARRRRAAVLAVSTHGQVADTTSLVLAGHLTTVGHEDVEGGRVHVVALLVHSVVLERDDPDSPTLVHRTLPLADWTAARPDPMRRTADQLLHHTNGAHADDLRDFVAGLRAISPDDVLAAELAELDSTGVSVHWLDASGAHRARVRFPRPATCPRALATLLRETLND